MTVAELYALFDDIDAECDRERTSYEDDDDDQDDQGPVDGPVIVIEA